MLSRQNELQPKLSDNEVNMIYNELLKYTKASKKTREEHDELFVNSTGKHLNKELVDHHVEISKILDNIQLEFIDSKNTDNL